MSQSSQYIRLQRFCQIVGTQTQGRRFNNVEVRSYNFMGWNSRILNVKNNSTCFHTSKIHRLCLPSCSKLHTSCRNFSNSFKSHKDYYRILNLKSNASATEIKSAYFKLSKKHHPDLTKSDTSSAAFLDIKEAYEVLGNEESRQEYDDSMLHRYPHHQNHRSDYDQFYSREKYWRESEAFKKQKKYNPDPMTFNPFDVGSENQRSFDGENQGRQEEVSSPASYIYNISMFVLAVVIVIGLSFDQTSKQDEKDPSLTMKKLETDALVKSVDLTKQKSQSEREICISTK